jgi:DNA-binding MarR family transcriptional regulator
VKLIDIVSNTPLPLAYRIAFITNFYREPLLRRMERDFNLIRPEWTILICLTFRDGVNARDICEITEQPRNTISRGVAALMRKGMIVQSPDTEDARRMLLHLTDLGRSTYDAIMPLFVESEARIASILSHAEQETLEALLDKLCRSVEQWRS